MAPWFSQASPAAKRHDLRLADHRDSLEVEGVEGLAGRQAGFGEMAFDAAATALGHLVLGEGGQEARCRPAFLVGLGGERGPDLFDGGQAQLGQQQLDAGGVDRVGRFHAASPNRTVPSSS